MKKNMIIGISLTISLLIIILFIYILHLDTIKCINTIKEDNYTIKNTYTIYHKKNIVKKVKIEKEITSKNNTILSYFLKNYKDEYKKYNKEYGGYKLSTKDGKNKKTLIIELNLSKVDYDKLKKGRSYLKDNINKNTINQEGIYKLFQLSKNSCQ